MTINTGDSLLKFPITSNHQDTHEVLEICPQEPLRIQKQKDNSRINRIINELQNIDFMTKQETNPSYFKNLQAVQDITQELSESKIRISPSQQHRNS